MQNEVNISKYAGYFHDGSLFNIKIIKNEIMFDMCSAEIDPLEIENEVALSKDHGIRGILHLRDIQNVHLTGECKLECLFDEFNLGTILDFEIMNNTVEFGVLWENHPPKAHTNEFTTIVIQAGLIWWENIPDLKHPFDEMDR